MPTTILVRSALTFAAIIFVHSMGQAQSSDTDNFVKEFSKKSLHLIEITTRPTYYVSPTYISEGRPDRYYNASNRKFGIQTVRLISKYAELNGLSVNETFEALKEHISYHDRALTKDVHINSDYDISELKDQMALAGERFVETLKLRMLVKQVMNQDLSITRLLEYQKSVAADLGKIEKPYLKSKTGDGLEIHLGPSSSDTIPFEIFNKFVMLQIENPGKNLKPFMRKVFIEVAKAEDALLERLSANSAKNDMLYKRWGNMLFEDQLPSEKITFTEVFDRLTNKVSARSCKDIF